MPSKRKLHENRLVATSVLRGVKEFHHVLSIFVDGYG